MTDRSDRAAAERGCSPSRSTERTMRVRSRKCHVDPERHRSGLDCAELAEHLIEELPLASRRGQLEQLQKLGSGAAAVMKPVMLPPGRAIGIAVTVADDGEYDRYGPGRLLHWRYVAPPCAMTSGASAASSAACFRMVTPLPVELHQTLNEPVPRAVQQRVDEHAQTTSRSSSRLPRRGHGCAVMLYTLIRFRAEIAGSVQHDDPEYRQHSNRRDQHRCPIEHLCSP